MIDYKLPKFPFETRKKLPKKSSRARNNQILSILVLSIFLSSVFGFLSGAISGSFFYLEVKDYLSKLNIELPLVEKVFEKEKVSEKEYIPQTSQEESIIKVFEEFSPTVVSIIVTKDLPILERYFFNPLEEFEEFFGETTPEFETPGVRQKGVETRKIGGGTGFIISEDGMILTNKHVVLDEEADYTVLTKDGRQFSAQVLARDPFQDLAVLKIENSTPFPIVQLGDSEKLQIGQTVIAIGNALGEFHNTVSVGVISGLGRTITASGGGIIETLEDVIQTDAAINKGNSGGPLLNLKGQVIGINTAMSLEGENIGFAIPINYAKKDIEQVKTSGKISYPYLGVYYAVINEKIQEKYDLPASYGALVGWNSVAESDEIRRTEIAVVPDSAAEKAGLKKDDIILEFDEKKITSDNSLAKIIKEYEPNDKLVLKVLRGGEEKFFSVILGEVGS